MPIIHAVSLMAIGAENGGSEREPFPTPCWSYLADSDQTLINGKSINLLKLFADHRDWANSQSYTACYLLLQLQVATMGTGCWSGHALRSLSFLTVLVLLPVAAARANDGPVDGWRQQADAVYQVVSDELLRLRGNLVVAPSVADTWFPASDFYQSVTVPVLSARGSRAYRVELVGQLYNSDRGYLLNIENGSMASAWFNHYGDSTTLASADLAVGMGASYNLRDDVALQALFSTGSLPHYGESNMAVGVSLRF